MTIQGWTCPRCGLERNPWQLRCSLDDTPQFPPSEQSPAERSWPTTGLATARQNEIVLVGTAVGEGPSERRQSPFRPARFATLVALLWLLAPVTWALLQRPNVVLVVAELLVLVALPLGLGYAIALRVSTTTPERAPPERSDEQSRRGVPRPARAFALSTLWLARWVQETFASRDRLVVSVIKLQQGLGAPTKVEVPGARPWPPPAAPVPLRVIGRWLAEPTEFDARLIQVLQLNRGQRQPGEAEPRVKATIRADRPLGWAWALLILGLAAYLMVPWLAAVVPIAQ